MGIVWRALDIKTGSAVAIKLMKDVSDPVAVDLFAKEWKALAEISHPNIVEVRDVDVIEENRQRKPFFVMPPTRGNACRFDRQCQRTPDSRANRRNCHTRVSWTAGGSPARIGSSRFEAQQYLRHG